MALRITIDVFSGRPNPSVVVEGRAERALLERLGRPRLTRAARAATTPPARLGYRGVRIETIVERGSPRGARPAATGPTLRIAHGLVHGEGGASAALDDPALERFLVGPDGPLRAAAPDVRLLEHLADTVQRAAPGAARARGRARSLDAAAAELPERCACAPLWEPAWWNDGGPIQSGNNCYNYATNVRTDTYAQPGRASGALFASASGADVRAAALADALADAPARNRCPGKGHLVALFVSPWDYHWYRKHRNGLWTHKPGPDPVTQLDNAGQPIADPRSADRAEYAQFVGFFVVQHGHVKLA